MVHKVSETNHYRGLFHSLYAPQLCVRIHKIPRVFISSARSTHNSRLPTRDSITLHNNQGDLQYEMEVFSEVVSRVVLWYWEKVHGKSKTNTMNNINKDIIRNIIS